MPLKIYPNPSYDKITIETYEIPTKGQLSILNLNGQELFKLQITKQKTVIEIKRLLNGVYLVKFTNERSFQVGKFYKH